MNDDKLSQLFDKEIWLERMAELKKANVTGVVFYTDGGHRQVSYIPRSGYGIHSYFFNAEKAEGLGSFKLDYPTARAYVEKKKVSKDEAVNVLYFGNIYGHIGGVTNQVAELCAFIQACHLFLECNMHEFTKEFLVHCDSKYVVQGVSDYLEGWKKNNWRKSDGMQVANLTYWKTIDSLVTKIKERDITVLIKHVYGHAFDTGNNIADQMATLGLYQNEPYGDQWVERSEYLASSFDFNPLMIDSKLLYYPSRKLEHSSDGKYYHYIYGNNSSQDNINEVGRNLIDSSIAVVITDNGDEGIKNLYDICRHLDKNMSSTPKVVDLNIATKPNLQVELSKQNILSIPKVVDKKDIRINTTNEKVAIVVLDPPRNSLTTLNNLNHLLDILKHFEGGKCENLKSVEITELLFDIELNGKGIPKYKFKVMEAVSIDVELPIWKLDGDKTIKVPLTFGLDLPRRRVFSNIKNLNPKVHAITWYENECLSYFATVVYIDGAVGIWSAEVTNTIDTEELSDEFYKK